MTYGAADPRLPGLAGPGAPAPTPCHDRVCRGRPREKRQPLEQIPVCFVDPNPEPTRGWGPRARAKARSDPPASEAWIVEIQGRDRPVAVSAQDGLVGYSSMFSIDDFVVRSACCIIRPATKQTLGRASATDKEDDEHNQP